MGFMKDSTFPSVTSLKPSLLSGRNTPLGSPTTDEEGGNGPEQEEEEGRSIRTLFISFSAELTS